MSVFALGSAIGGIGGGLLAEHFGWRHGLIVFAGASAALLVLLAFVREPRRGVHGGETTRSHGPGGMKEATVFIRQQRALLHIMAGSAVAAFSGMGLVRGRPRS